MNLTRGIAICGLTLAIALAIGAISPMQPSASAGNLQPIFSSAPAHVVPTPALATAVPVVEQLPSPTPQVIYIQLPPPQVVYVQSPAEIPAAAPLAEQLPPAAPAGDPALTPGTPEYNTALWSAYNANPLPEVHCPCGVDTAPAPAITDRQRQQSRQRTR